MINSSAEENDIKNDVVGIIIIYMENQFSLFDSDLDKQKLGVRSNKRRSAMIIPKEVGAKMIKKINEELNKEMDDKNHIK